MHAPRFVYAPSLFGQRRRARLPFLRPAPPPAAAPAAPTTSPAPAAAPAVRAMPMRAHEPESAWRFVDPARLHAARRAHPKAYAAWSALEEARLRMEHEAGHALDDIARSLGRTPGALKARLARLGRRAPERRPHGGAAGRIEARA